MKTKLFTKNIALGLLVAFVLALGVQGIADALTLTARSSVNQSERMGFPFDISFSVGVTGNTEQKDRENRNRRINANDHASPYQLIDSSGYEVFYIGTTTRSYRITTETPSSRSMLSFR